jgi:hypothetical protein
MNREEIIATIIPLETETKVKAWIFQIEKKFYHVAEYGGVYRVPETSAIWESNKKGKRLTQAPLFEINKKDHKRCVNEFLTILEEKQIEEELQKESQKD